MSVIEVLKTPSVMRKAISSYLPLLVLIIGARASESFQWQTDEGWFGERILLPPRFAPDMSGKELRKSASPQVCSSPINPTFSAMP